MEIIFKTGSGDGKTLTKPTGKTIWHPRGDEGVYIRPHGTGAHVADAGHGWPVLVETYNGRPQVIIWSDINNDEPTHVIDLSGALESNRLEEDN